MLWAGGHNSKCTTSLQSISASPSVCSHTRQETAVARLPPCPGQSGLVFWQRSVTSPPQRPSPQLGLWGVLAPLPLSLQPSRVDRSGKKPEEHRRCHGDDVDSASGGVADQRGRALPPSSSCLSVCVHLFCFSAPVLCGLVFPDKSGCNLGAPPPACTPPFKRCRLLFLPNKLPQCWRCAVTRGVNLSEAALKFFHLSSVFESLTLQLQLLSVTSLQRGATLVLLAPTQSTCC